MKKAGRVEVEGKGKYITVRRNDPLPHCRDHAGPEPDQGRSGSGLRDEPVLWERPSGSVWRRQAALECAEQPLHPTPALGAVARDVLDAELLERPPDLGQAGLVPTGSPAVGV